MCGITGYISKNDIKKNHFIKSSETQNHRGPDNQDYWFSKIGNFNINLGHQRLNIIDLSLNSNQPMTNKLEDSALIFNGEIYNYIEIKKELQDLGLKFKTSGDTEVLFKALNFWGIKKTVKKLNGMWSFAWLDKNEKKLYLSRDRFGEKPLYYTVFDDNIIFTSEIKTLLKLSGEKYDLNYNCIKKYLEFGILNDDNNTFFKNIKQVKPAHNIEFSLKDKIILNEKSYWDLSKVRINPDMNFDNHVEKLRSAFKESVKLRLRSDVPVGVLLSGGIDSSSIAGIIKEITNNKIHLFSAVSDEKEFDESYFIDIMQKALDWPITKVKLSNNPKKLFDDLKLATWYADAPIGSLSPIYHYSLMKKAKEKGIRVILSGQGADELLCGYLKYLPFFLQEKLQTFKFIEGLNLLKGFLSNTTFLKGFSIAEAKRYMPKYFNFGRTDTYGEALNAEESISISMKSNSTVAKRQIQDLNRFSVPFLNHFEDRMSMANSREIRLPFLDYKLVELIMSTPTDFKLKNGWTKYSFRQAINNIIPNKITWRKDKKGFTSPQGEWIKNQLKNEILNDYFSSKSNIFKMKIYNQKKLLELYSRYCNQKIGSGSISFKQIFYPLALEIWLRTFSENIKNCS